MLKNIPLGIPKKTCKCLGKKSTHTKRNYRIKKISQKKK